MRSCYRFLLIGVLLLMTAAHAQAQTGTVTGMVTGDGGLPVPSVNVGIEGTTLGAATDERGRYTIYRVPANALTVTATAVGFEPVRQAVAVEPGETVTADFILEQTVEELGEVTVTGLQRRTATVTKTMTPLKNLPISVQMIGEEVMHQQQVADLREVVRNISGITPTGTYNGGYVYYNSRGFDMSNWSNFRRNGMFIWNMGHHYADNIERVEVLKGPASIQYGDVAPGGILNFVTKKPLPYDYRRVELRVGQYSLLRPSIDLSGPLADDGRLLYRINAAYETSDSFRDQVEHETILLAPALTWQVTPALRWTVEGTYKLDDRVGDPGQISPDGTFDGLRQISISEFYGEPGATYTFEDKSVFSTADYFLSDTWALRNVTYYTDTFRTPYNIYFSGTEATPEGAFERTQYYFHQWFRGWGTDLNLAGEVATGPLVHQLVVGADYMFNHSRYTNGIDETLETNIDAFDPEYGQSTLLADPMDWADTRFFYQRLGLYVQDQVSLLRERVQVLAGLRFNIATAGDRYDDSADEPEGYEPTTERPLSPRFGLVGKPVAWLSLYGSYAEAFEINGPDWIDPRIIVPPTDSRQVEVGAKASLLDDRLGVAASVFQIEKEDIYNYVDTETAPAFDFIAFDPEGAYATYQGGTHRSRGIELDVNGRVLGDALTVTATAAYIDAEVVEDPAFAAGNWLNGQPRESFSLWANYAVPRGALEGLELGYGLFHRGEFYQSTDNDPAGRVDAYTSMDATAAYTLGRVKGRLTVQNLTDNTGYLSSFGVYEPLWPRRVLFSLAAEF